MANGQVDEARLRELIERVREDDSVDGKRACAWDGKATSASLTKDILAFANSRDGGAIVIGVEELPDHTFADKGVSDDELASFDTTKVASWVNAHCAPEVKLVCYPVRHNQKQYVVIVVEEFDDVPIVCTKNYQEDGARKYLLREGFIYTRTASATSEPVRGSNAMRRLVSLASAKRHDELLRSFTAFFDGRPLLAPATPADVFAQSRDAISSALEERGKSLPDTGRWNFYIQPQKPQEWPDAITLKEALDRASIRRMRYSTMPPGLRDARLQMWGLYHIEDGEEFFFATVQGVLQLVLSFRENQYPFRNPWRSLTPSASNGDVDAGQWIDFEWNHRILVEFFWFLSRWCHELPAGTRFEATVEASGLNKRILATLNSRISLDPTPPTNASTFRRRKQFSVEELRGNWKNIAASVSHDFFSLFETRGDISHESLTYWIEKWTAEKLG